MHIFLISERKACSLIAIVEEIKRSLRGTETSGSFPHPPNYLCKGRQILCLSLCFPVHRHSEMRSILIEFGPQ